MTGRPPGKRPLRDRLKRRVLDLLAAHPAGLLYSDLAHSLDQAASLWLALRELVGDGLVVTRQEEREVRRGPGQRRYRTTVTIYSLPEDP